MKEIKTIIVGIVVAAIAIDSVSGQNLCIKNVNIINVENGQANTEMDVYIHAGIISKISKSTYKKKDYKNFTVIEGTGKYLLPGFIDTHAHVAMGPIGFSFVDGQPILKLTPIDDLPKISAELLIKHGITTTRDPGGRTDLTVKVKNDVASGKIKGPEFFVAGGILDTAAFENLVSKVKTKEDIIKEIRTQKAAGVDYIKLYTSLNPQQIKAGIDEAHRLDLGTISHLHTTSWTEASKLGIDNIVHIIPGNESYLPEQHRETYRKDALMGAIGFYKWFEYVDLESSEIVELIQTLKKNNTSIDPTLIVFHVAFFGNTKNYTANSMLNELPVELVDNWKSSFNFNLGWTNKHFDEAQKTWPKVQKFVRKLYHEGILLTAGTDANNPWIVPGDSFHKELALLADCGLSNAEVLEIATLNGAKLLKKEDQIGTIEKGKEADLVLLNSNPLENILNSRDIKMTFLNGVVVD